MNIPDLARNAEAFRAQKRPIPVSVRFADANGVLVTREGLVAYEAGDALLAGVEGECWPVQRQRFFETYDPCPPTEKGSAGEYIKRSLAVWAWRTNGPIDIALSNNRGILHADADDVIVQYAPGDLAVVGHSIFQKTYEVLGQVEKKGGG